MLCFNLSTHCFSPSKSSICLLEVVKILTLFIKIWFLFHFVWTSFMLFWDDFCLFVNLFHSLLWKMLFSLSKFRCERKNYFPSFKKGCCVYMFVWYLHASVQVPMTTYTQAEATADTEWLLPPLPVLLPWDRVLLNRNWTDWLGDQWALGIWLFLSPQCWGILPCTVPPSFFTWVVGIWTRASTFAKQALLTTVSILHLQN